MQVHKTSVSVKVLIALTIGISLLSPIVTFILNHYFQLAGPAQWFSLSRMGLLEGWLWQPLTYFFIQSAGIGISVSLLISLFFLMFLLWFTASEIDFRFGSRSFILFYLSAGIVSGLVATAALFAFSIQSVVVGSGPPIFALVMLWAMLYPDLELYFFFLLKVKAKWLVALLLGIAFLIDLSYGEFILFLANLTGVIWGFVMGKLVWKLPNPYPLNLELPKWRKKRGSGKIIDISVIHESDDAFMNRMLDKISKKGQQSLTRREKDRMKKISEKRKR